MSDLTATAITCRLAGRDIVDRVDVVAPAGQMTAIVGHNGSGKSTLLRAMAGVTRPASGVVHVGSRRIDRLGPAARARLLTFVAQEEMPSAELRVGEYVALGRTPHRKPWSGGTSDELRIVRHCLARVGLLPMIDRSCAQMSGGERRRAALARAFAQDCPVMLLDEPTNHLDIASQLHLLQLLREAGRTVLAAVHDLDLAMAHFDVVHVLHERRIIASGPPADVLTPDVIAVAFDVDASVVTSPSGRAHLVFESRAKEES